MDICKSVRWMVFIAFIIIGLNSTVNAEDTPVPPAKPVLKIILSEPSKVTEPPPEISDTPFEVNPAIIKLNDILKDLKERRKLLQIKETQLKSAKLETDKKSLAEEIKSISDAIKEQDRSFEMITTGGMALSSLENQKEKPFDWQKELLDILQPIMSELHQLTAKRRKIESLRNRLHHHQEQVQVIEEALSNIFLVPTDKLEAETQSRLKSIQKQWQKKLKENQHLMEVNQLQLEEMEKSEKNMEPTPSERLKAFASGRGATLFLALFAALSLYGLLQLLKSLVRMGLKRKNKSTKPLERLLGLVYQLATILLSIGTLFFVFHMRGDRVMQGLAILLLVGVLWTLKNSIPRYIEELKLILNIGPVREGERVVYQGLPWRVDSLNVFTQLSNPALSMPCLRVPLQSVVHLESRKFHSGEAWFPCEVGSYVVLSDETYGQVTTISVDGVVLTVIGNSTVSYTMSDFLSATPKNLSVGFSVATIFGISYTLQTESTSQVLAQFEEGFKERMKHEKVGEHLICVSVQFNEAASSSLNYRINAIFRGTGACHYSRIARMLQRLAVDICNEHGWEIPFTQIVVHQGD